MFVVVEVVLYFNVGNLYHWWCVGDGMLQRERERERESERIISHGVVMQQSFHVK